MRTVLLRASDMDGFLTAEDKASVVRMGGKDDEAIELYRSISADEENTLKGSNVEKLAGLYNEIGFEMRAATQKTRNIHVYSFETPDPIHGEVSRLIAKLRDIRTEQSEFIYYVQRAYELLFNFAFVASGHIRK